MEVIRAMSKLFELKEMLLEELKKYGGKKDLSPGDLAIVDTLTHALKNLCKVIEDMDEGGEYSGRGGRYSGARRYDGGPYGSYDDSYDGGSYARGRGRYAKRDSMGRYSSEDYSRAADDVIGQLEGMMDSAPDEHSRTKIRELIREMKKV